jgi:hypothetical protein
MREVATVGEFIELVERMRKAQKAYFRMKLQSNLEKAKALEKEVDALIEARRKRAAAARQPELVSEERDN